MSKGRTYYGVSDFSVINKIMNLKNGKSKAKPRKYDEDKRKAQRAKFCKCKECGGMMTFVPNTNTLVCTNIVKKKRSITNATDGTTKSFEVEEKCGAINVVADNFVDYLNYLFDGVEPNAAVVEAANKAANKVSKEEK